jgi:hypothetical protein
MMVLIGNLGISDGRNIWASNLFTHAHTRLKIYLDTSILANSIINRRKYYLLQREKVNEEAIP